MEFLEQTYVYMMENNNSNTQSGKDQQSTGNGVHQLAGIAFLKGISDYVWISLFDLVMVDVIEPIS